MAASESPPPTSSSTPYIVGAVILAALAFGLYRWKASTSTTTEPQVVHVTAPPTEEPAPINAPPPPPKVEELPDAGEDAGKAPVKVSGNGSGNGACGKCDNPASPALQSALRGAAQSAQGCYQRALRTGEASGNMMVSVQVAASGSVCTAGISNDSVHSNEVSQCGLGRFRGRTFPSPGSGCSTVNIPLNFVAK